MLCGKVQLQEAVRGGAGIFATGKRDSSKLREVWKCNRLSAAAVKPPKPTHLASPSALLNIESVPGRPVLLTKRDGRCLFDQLKVPVELRSWFGRPSITVRELLGTGMVTIRDIERAQSDGEVFDINATLFPVSVVWPMGFSWSSYLAQCTMLCVCRMAHLKGDRVLADDVDPPLHLGSVFALATDDIMHFSSHGRKDSEQVGRDLDSSMVLAGVQKHGGKDITAAAEETCIGIDLVAGRYFAPNSSAMKTVFDAIAYILKCYQSLLVSPRQLASLLGTMQWHCLLGRPSFAVFHHVSGFVKHEPQDVGVLLPKAVVTALMQFALVAPFLEADVCRAWSSVLIATDASPAYGFGVSALNVGSDRVKSLGRWSLRPNSMAVTDDNLTPEEFKIRVGEPVKVPFRKSDFRIVLSQRKTFDGHSGALEAAGLVLGVKWHLRARSHLSQRLVVPVDAQAVLFAAAKGRSSAPSLRFEIRKLAALALAGNLSIKYLYVPSEYNPADAPSRGVVFPADRARL